MSVRFPKANPMYDKLQFVDEIENPEDDDKLKFVKPHSKEKPEPPSRKRRWFGLQAFDVFIFSR
jgi:hypothetical protein